MSPLLCLWLCLLYSGNQLHGDHGFPVVYSVHAQDVAGMCLPGGRALLRTGLMMGEWRSVRLQRNSRMALPMNLGQGGFRKGAEKDLEAQGTHDMGVSACMGVCGCSGPGLLPLTLSYPWRCYQRSLTLLPHAGSPKGSKDCKFITSGKSRGGVSRDSVQSIFYFLLWGVWKLNQRRTIQCFC